MYCRIRSRAKASVILFGAVGLNERIALVIPRASLMRSGEAGKKQGVDFAAGGHCLLAPTSPGV
jgi:hypothetical protein